MYTLFSFFSWEICISPRAFHNNSLCKNMGLRVKRRELEKKKTESETLTQYHWKRNNHIAKHYSCRFLFLLNNQRYRRRDSVLRLFQQARRELPITLLYKWPFLIPRFLRPAAVSPRSSRCLWTGLQIQLTLGSRRTALWNGSTIMTSKNLYVESSATQYELRTRRLPQYRPARSCKKKCIPITMYIQIVLTWNI